MQTQTIQQNNQPHSYFISDLHLQQSEPEVAKMLIDFLQGPAPQADQLIILGDLFEMWVGDDDQTAFHQKIIAAFKQASDRGLKIFFMHGNRDFLIGRRFLKETGMVLLDDPTVIDLYGQRTLLAHGDLLCTLDKRHQRFRRCISHPLFKRLILTLPLRWRKKLGVKTRQTTRNYSTKLAQHISDVYPAEIEKQLKQHQCQQLIHGHTHRPATHSFKLDDLPAKRIVLGDWHANRAMILRYDQDHQCQLLDLAC